MTKRHESSPPPVALPAQIPPTVERHTHVVRDGGTVMIKPLDPPPEPQEPDDA